MYGEYISIFAKKDIEVLYQHQHGLDLPTSTRIGSKHIHYHTNLCYFTTYIVAMSLTFNICALYVAYMYMYIIISHTQGGRRSPAVACWASDHWVASSNPLRGKFRH